MTVSESHASKPMTPAQERITRLIMRAFSKANVWVYRVSGGRLGAKFQGGAPVMLVSMMGCKSGKLRTTPLIHVSNGDDVLLVASQGGMAKNPVWYANVVANPEVTVQVGSTTRRMRARQVDDSEKQALWPVICAVHPDFEAYQQRTERNIPVFVCSPISQAVS